MVLIELSSFVLLKLLHDKIEIKRQKLTQSFEISAILETSMFNLKRSLIFCIIFISILWHHSSFSKITPILYKQSQKGSQGLFDPISYYFNTAFDTIQNPYYFNQKNFLNNHKKVLKKTFSIKNSIEEGGGFETFMRNEVIGIRALPNYTLHLIGSSYDFRKLAEWFDFHQYPYPYVWSFVLSYFGHLGNEAIESSNESDITAHDHLADLYIFDFIGKFIFMNDHFVKYLKENLNMTSWPYQPFYIHDGDDILNAGSNFIFRPQLKNIHEVTPFVHFGMQILFGISVPIESLNLSVASGPAFTDPLQNKSRLATGIYLDEDNNLLASLIINGTDDLKFRLNIYPGVFKVHNWTSGFALAQERSNEFWFSVNFNLPLGIGSNF